MYSILQAGLTGGIGAGKTTVAEIFKTLDIPIYSADLRARHLMQTDAALIAAVKDLLGEEAYNVDLQLNRGWVAKQVFNNHDQLTKLNYLVHPAVKRDGDEWHRKQTDVPYTLKEAALTFESGHYLALDAVISVEARESIRIARVMERDRVSEAAVKARISNQWPAYRRRQVADFIIENNGDKSLIQQVFKVHRALIAMANDGH